MAKHFSGTLRYRPAAVLALGRAALALLIAVLAILAPAGSGRAQASPLVDPLALFQPPCGASHYYYHYAWYDHPLSGAPLVAASSDPTIACLDPATDAGSVDDFDVQRIAAFCARTLPGLLPALLAADTAVWGQR